MVSSLPPAQFNTTNTIGVDITATFPHYQTPSSSASSTQLFYPETQNPEFAPGQIVLAGGGATYIFSQVGSVGSINTGDFVAFLVSIASTFTVQQITSTLAALGPRVGIYQGSTIGYGNFGTVSASLPATSSTLVQWCWIALKGSNLFGNIVSTTAVNVPLFVSSIAGFLSSASTSTFQVANVTNTASTASVVAPVPTPVFANPMMIGQPTSAASTAFIVY
jgi:hypothetical protein